MSKLQTTIEALESALSDVPNTPTAWVPLRRATVEAAHRLLGGIPVALAMLGALDNENGAVPAAPTPTWRYPVLSFEEAASQGEPVFVADEVRVLPGNGSTSARANGNGNGAVTVAPAEQLTYTQPTNTWRRRPKAERLALVKETIARLAVNGWLTQSEFDRGKPDYMPTGPAHVAAFAMSWSDLVKAALASAEESMPASAEAEVAADEAEPFRG